MNIIQKLISKLYWKYCFKKSNLASYIMLYYIPFIMKNLDYPGGNYVVGIINDTIKEENIEVWNPPAGTKRGELLSLGKIDYKNEKFYEKIKDIKNGNSSI